MNFSPKLVQSPLLLIQPLLPCHTTPRRAQDRGGAVSGGSTFPFLQPRGNPGVGLLLLVDPYRGSVILLGRRRSYARGSHTPPPQKIPQKEAEAMAFQQFFWRFPLQSLTAVFPLKGGEALPRANFP